MPSRSTAGAAAGVDVHAVKRFFETVPVLQQLLELPPASERELRLRAEMRRTIAKLAATLEEAARDERRKTRAKVYRAAAVVAAQLAAAPPAVVVAPVSGDH